MILLHNIGEKINSNYNTLEEILACDEPISFDGVYRNVYENWDQIKHKDVTLFVMGDYIGKDNSFDKGQKLEKLCTLSEILEMGRDGARLGWHSWSHRDLTTLTDDEIRSELIAPVMFKRYLAYPYGKFNGRVIDMVKEAMFQEAWSVTDGDNSQFQMVRRYL